MKKSNPLWRAALVIGWLMAIASLPAALLLPAPIGLVLVLGGAILALTAERWQNSHLPASEEPDPRLRRWHILLLVCATALALLFLVMCGFAPLP